MCHDWVESERHCLSGDIKFLESKLKEFKCIGSCDGTWHQLRFTLYICSCCNSKKITIEEILND